MWWLVAPSTNANRIVELSEFSSRLVDNGSFCAEVWLLEVAA